MYSNVYSCCIFSTQALNVVYLFVCFHYFTRPTDFSRCIFSTQSPNVPYCCVCSGYYTRPTDF